MLNMKKTPHLVETGLTESGYEIVLLVPEVKSFRVLIPELLLFNNLVNLVARIETHT